MPQEVLRSPINSPTLGSQSSPSPQGVEMEGLTVGLRQLDSMVVEVFFNIIDSVILRSVSLWLHNMMGSRSSTTIFRCYQKPQLWNAESLLRKRGWTLKTLNPALKCKDCF